MKSVRPKASWRLMSSSSADCTLPGIFLSSKPVVPSGVVLTTSISGSSKTSTGCVGGALSLAASGVALVDFAGAAFFSSLSESAITVCCCAVDAVSIGSVAVFSACPGVVRINAKTADKCRIEKGGRRMLNTVWLQIQRKPYFQRKPQSLL